VLWKNITPHPVVRKSLMAKTWYTRNFSGFYVNGKSYYKLTGIATYIHYKDVSLQWENKKIEQKLKFPDKMNKLFLVVREPRQNLSNGPRVGKG